MKQHHRRQSTVARIRTVTTPGMEETPEPVDDDQESGVFHVRLNGVCTFTPYTERHRTPTQRQHLKYEVGMNIKKGRRITARRYFEGMAHNEKVACWIELDNYLQDYLLNHGMKSG